MTMDRDEALWGSDAQAVRAVIESQFGHHPERSIVEQETAAYAAVKAVRKTDGVRIEDIREALIKVLPRDMFDPDAKADPDKNVWECKVGYALDKELPQRADLPMRHAVEKTFRLIVGDYPDFITSGWGAILSPGEEHAMKSGSIDLAHQHAWNLLRDLIHGKDD